MVHIQHVSHPPLCHALEHELTRGTIAALHGMFKRDPNFGLGYRHHASSSHNRCAASLHFCAPLRLSMQGLGQGAMRWSGDAGANPFAGKLNTFWSIWASNLPVKVDYVGQLAAARASMQKMQQAARLTLFARPALTQGYQQVVVDMPLDSSMPTIREVGGRWLGGCCRVQPSWHAPLWAVQGAVCLQDS
jgi:hypothetical protein